MGTAEIIPGISGGTVALILGIYKRLIIAISSVNQDLFKLLIQFQFKKVWPEFGRLISRLPAKVPEPAEVRKQGYPK